jgi:hypothetical protein
VFNLDIGLGKLPLGVWLLAAATTPRQLNLTQSRIIQAASLDGSLAIFDLAVAWEEIPVKSKMD